jgi:cation:H+ antiporter
MWTTLLQFTGGLLLLMVGAELLIRGGASLALRMGVSALVVGLTVISFGTSSPELVVSIKAAWDHDSAIALGNVVGSNICNIALVLGLSALIRPLKVHSQVVRLEVPIMIAVTVLLGILLHNRRLSQVEGSLFGILLIAYIVYSIFQSRKVETESAADVDPLLIKKQYSVPLALVMLVGGIALLVPGSHFFVKASITVAQWAGLSPYVIGVTVVAVGTSLPEIATSVAGAIKGEGDMAVGNAIGSNIFNILCILGLSAGLFGIDASSFSFVDLIAMLGFAVVSLPLLRSGFTLTRWEGALLILLYAVYVTYLIMMGPQ